MYRTFREIVHEFAQAILLLVSVVLYWTIGIGVFVLYFLGKLS